MLNQNNDFVSISLTDEVLKVVHLKGAGSSAKVVHVIAKDIKGMDEGDLSVTVQNSLRGLNAKSANLLCVIPSSMTTSKNIEIPSTNPEEIKSIVNLQAGRHTPYSREEIQVGYINIGVYKTNYSKVLLVIANRHVIKKQLEILEKAGLKIKKVLFGPEGIASFYAKALDLKAATNPTGIIDIGKQSTDIVITKWGVAIMSRNIPVGRMHLMSEGASASAKLVDELKKTIEAYQSEDLDALPQSYVLTVNDETTQGLQKALQEKLKWNVEIKPYIDHIKTAGNTLNQLATDFADQSLLDTIASAVNIEEAQINFMPEEVQLQKSLEDQGREVAKTVILCFMILALVAGIFGLRIYYRNTYLNKLKNDEKYKVKREEVLALQNRSSRNKIIQKFLTERMVSLDVIGELYKNLPNEVYLTGISMDDQGTVSVQGISDVGSLVYILNSKLKESQIFKSADVKSKTAKKDRGKDVHAFEITLKLKSAVEDEKSDVKVDGKADTVKKGE